MRRLFRTFILDGLRQR
uniref:Uncharacterized protein n=1 Tax=Romanomermis culicivorax TaxID=13658 RepID=A0A915KIL0_ROMCU